VSSFNTEIYPWYQWVELPDIVKRLISMDAVERALAICKPYGREPSSWMINLYKRAREAQMCQCPPPIENREFSFISIQETLKYLTNAPHANCMMKVKVGPDRMEMRLFESKSLYPDPLYFNQNLYRSFYNARRSIDYHYRKNRSQELHKVFNPERKVIESIRKPRGNFLFDDWAKFRIEWIMEQRAQVAGDRIAFLIPEGKLTPPSGLELLGNGHPTLF